MEINFSEEKITELSENQKRILDTFSEAEKIFGTKYIEAILILMEESIKNKTII